MSAPRRIQRAKVWDPLKLPGMDPGLWRPLKRGDGTCTAWMTCFCGAEATLAMHTIHEDGCVRPSVICQKCGWHGVVVLVGWKGGEAPGE